MSPINGLSGLFRPPRLMKIRLGYKEPGKNFPRDSDVFVGRTKDGVTPAIIKAYQGKQIDNAEADTLSLGKSLRMLSYFEWDALHPTTGTELVLNLLNRSWAHSKLRCSGTGGDDRPGQAICRDEAYKTAIAKATKTAPKASADGKSWTVQCLGPRCPMWHTNSETNKLAGCHRELRFLAQLLHPTTDPEDPNYLKNYGSAEIVSGSFNGIIDVQSGLQLLRSVAGRSANIPFLLQRKPRELLADGRRVVKATLMVSFDNDEAIRFGYSDPKLSLVRPEVRKQLMAQKREQLELARMEITFDSVKDILPQLEAPKSSESGRTDYPLTGSATGSGGGETAGGAAGSATAAGGDAVPDSSTSTTDRDDAVAAATEPPPLSDAELNRRLDASERNQLKTLSGGTPGEPATLGKFRDLAVRACEHFGDKYEDLTSLRVRHALWIKERLAEEAQSSDRHGETTPPRVIATATQDMPSAATSAPPPPVQQELIP